MLQALHEYLERRLPDLAFLSTADDAVRLAVEAQLRAGVDVVSDGEQRRDSYASFVGARLDNCELIRLHDLLPLVDDPAAFEQELRALVAVENDCCRWASWSVDRKEGVLVMAARSKGEGISTLHGMFKEAMPAAARGDSQGE